MRRSAIGSLQSATSKIAGEAAPHPRLSTAGCRLPSLVGASAPLHVAEEVAVRRDHNRGASFKRGVVGAHRAVEGGEFRIAAVSAGEDAGAFGFTLASRALGFFLRGGADDGGVAFAFGADAAGDLLTLGTHALVDAFLRFRRQVGLADTDIDDADAQFGGGGGVEVVFDGLHQLRATP